MGRSLVQLGSDRIEVKRQDRVNARVRAVPKLEGHVTLTHIVT